MRSARTGIASAAVGIGLGIGALAVTAQPAQAAGPIKLPYPPTIPLVPVDLGYYAYVVEVCGNAIINDPANAAKYVTVLLSGPVSPFGDCVNGSPL